MPWVTINVDFRSDLLLIRGSVTADSPAPQRLAAQGTDHQRLLLTGWQ